MNSVKQDPGIEVLKEKVKKIEKKLDPPTCTICANEFVVDEELVQLPCFHKHMYHITCYKNWSKENIISHKCPGCKKQLKLTDIQ